MLKIYLRGFLFGFGVLILLLFFGMGDNTPVWYYYIFYPIGLAGLSLFLSRKNQIRLGWNYGIAVCIPMLIFWGFFITVNMEWNADKIGPVILTVILSILTAYYFSRKNKAIT